MPEIGKAIDCPNCGGRGFLASGKPKGKPIACPVCHRERRVEYQENDGNLSAPTGSWLPTRRRGASGWLVVIFGRGVQAVSR